MVMMRIACFSEEATIELKLQWTNDYNRVGRSLMYFFFSNDKLKWNLKKKNIRKKPWKSTINKIHKLICFVVIHTFPCVSTMDILFKNAFCRILKRVYYPSVFYRILIIENKQFWYFFFSGENEIKFFFCHVPQLRDLLNNFHEFFQERLLKRTEIID